MDEPALVDRPAAGLRLIVDPSARARGLVLAFSDRKGGASPAPYDSLNLAASVGDERANVDANRAAVAGAAGFEPGSVRFARQIHGADVLEVTSADPTVAGEADVLVTSEPGVTIGILTADCTPVVLAGPDGVAVAHAGWRGLVAGVIEAAVRALGRVETAWIGPSIHACCYEVGPEVVTAFESRGLPIAAPDRVDPGRAAAFALRRVGIERIALSTDCTSCDRRYFSYRRDGTTGRQGAFVSRMAR
ncbi:MAG TPA: peptidoglycan editing factor PgeF [Actinomycetota bacterium]|nr:peptidoglycan editing factor PgeF [Actinomycetota bacterium]